MRPDILHFLYLLKFISFMFNCSVIALGEFLCYWIKSEQLHSDFTWPYLYGPAKKITVLPLDFPNSPHHICLYFLFYITILCTHLNRTLKNTIVPLVCILILMGCQGCILSPCLLNLYAEYIMWNARMDVAQAGIKTAGWYINNLRHTDDTTLMAETAEELKSLLMKVKEESEKAGLKLNIQKTKIMTSGPITSWQIDGETMEIVRHFILEHSKITADGDCSYEIKRRLLLGRKAMTNIDSILKSRDITLPKKFCLIKATVFQQSCMDVRVGL